jgi:hypothetical protein
MTPLELGLDHTLPQLIAQWSVGLVLALPTIYFVVCWANGKGGN